MTPINIRQPHSTAGIALLMTMMVLGVVLAVTLAIVELSLQQLALSVDSKDSEIAFHAANAGLECARYTRRHASSSFDKGNAVIFNCFGTTQSVTKASLGTVTAVKGVKDFVYRYTTDVDWGAGVDRCSSIDLITMIVSTTSNADVSITAPSGLDTVFPGYPTASKTCAPGAVCTIAAVAGYNAACSAKDGAGVLKRQVLLEF